MGAKISMKLVKELGNKRQNLISSKVFLVENVIELR